MKTSYLCLGLSCWVAVACKRGDEPRTQEQFCEDWAEAACSEETVSACQATDAAQCRLAQAEFCERLVPRKGFSDERGDACIDAVRAAYTDGDLKAGELATVLRLAPPCDELTAGTKHRGDACDEDANCDVPAGYRCVRKADRQHGSCETPEEVGAGRDCSAPQKTCPVGFYCNGENCIEAKQVGASCTIPAQCVEDAYCDAGKCAKRLKINEACESDAQCASGICYELDGDKSCADRIRLARSEPVCDDLK